MAGLGSFFLEFGVDISTLQKGINNAETRLTSFAKKAEDIGTKLSVGVSLPLSIIGKNALQTSAQFESLEMSFGTMLRSMDKGKQLMQDLQKYNLATSFNFEEVAKAGKSMLAFGFAQQQIIPNLKMIGDISAGVGIKVDELAEIYGKAKVQGRLFAEDINQLTGRGIPIIAELAKQFGVSETAIKKMTEDGKIGFNNLEKAFESLTAKGGQFYNMTANQSTTMQGLYSNLEDSITNNLRTIGDSLVKNLDLKTVIPQATQYLNDLTKKFTELSPEAQKAIVVIGGAATVIPPFLALAGTALPAIKAGFLALISPAGLAGTAIAGAAIYAITHWDKLQKVIDDTSDSLERNTLTLRFYLAKMRDAMQPGGNAKEIAEITKKSFDYVKRKRGVSQSVVGTSDLEAYYASKDATDTPSGKPKPLAGSQDLKAAKAIADNSYAIQQELASKTRELVIASIEDQTTRAKLEAKKRAEDEISEYQNKIIGLKGVEDDFAKWREQRQKNLVDELTRIEREAFKTPDAIKTTFVTDVLNSQKGNMQNIADRYKNVLPSKISNGTKQILNMGEKNSVGQYLGMDISMEQWQNNSTQYIQAAEGMVQANNRIKNSMSEIALAAGESMGLTIANMMAGTATITDLANNMLQTVGNIFADMLKQLAAAQAKLILVESVFNPTALLKTIGLAAGAGILAGLSNKIGQGRANNMTQQRQGASVYPTVVRGSDILTAQQRFQTIKSF